MLDITWCASPDCPVKDCKVHVRNCPHKKGEKLIISVADFSGTCRAYVSILLDEVKTNIFDEEEIHENCTVQILKNSITGETSVGWWENES